MRRRWFRTIALATVLLVGASALASAATAQSATLVYTGDKLSLEAGEGQEIVGQTTLESGSTVRIRIESAEVSSPFLLQPETTVDDDGRFRTYVDLSHVEPGTTATVTVVHDGDPLTKADAMVGECDQCGPAARIDRDGDRLAVRAGPGQVIAGETSLDEGTSVVVEIRSESAEQQFRIAKEAVVTRNGTFETNLDLSDVRAGTPLRVAIRHDGEELTATRGEVLACEADCQTRATPTPTHTPTIATDELGFKSVVEVGQSGTARIPVGFGDADAATITIGTPEQNFVTSATVRDGNGDGRATVEFDTAAVGTDGRAVTVTDPGDELTTRETDADVDGDLDTGAYDMALYEGDATSGEPADIGTLLLVESKRPGADRLTLEKGFLQTERGATPSIPVRLGASDTATVVIDNDAVDYGVNATVRDGNGDGRVAVSVRTAAAGTDRPTLVAGNEADEVNVTDPEPRFDGPMPATQYDVALYRGPNPVGNPASVGTLSVVADGEGAGSTETAALDEPSRGIRGVDLGGIGALTAGSILAVVGVGLLLGQFRT